METLLSYAGALVMFGLAYLLIPALLTATNWFQLGLSAFGIIAGCLTAVVLVISTEY